MSKIYIFPRSAVHFTEVNVLTAQRHTSKCRFCVKDLQHMHYFLYKWFSKILLRKPFVIQIAYPFRRVILVKKTCSKVKNLQPQRCQLANFLLLKAWFLFCFFAICHIWMVTWWAINQKPLLRALPQCNPSFLFVIFCRGSCYDFNSSHLFPNGRLFQSSKFCSFTSSSILPKWMKTGQLLVTRHISFCRSKKFPSYIQLRINQISVL